MSVALTASWEDKVDAYHLIQRNCDWPAAVWFNFQWQLMLDGATPVVVDTKELLGIGGVRLVHLILQRYPNIFRDYCHGITAKSPLIYLTVQ